MGAADALVRILDAGAEPVGLGFVVHGGLLTCAHVVNAALHREQRDPSHPGRRVRVGVQFLRPSGGLPPEKGEVELELWGPESTNFDYTDVAGFVMPEGARLPVGVTPVKLGRRPDRPREPRAFGPTPERQHGGWVPVRIEAEVPGGRVQLTQPLRGTFRIQRGFSGGPIVDLGAETAWGMVTAVGSEEGADDAYMLPVAALLQAWPALDATVVSGDPAPILVDASHRQHEWGDGAAILNAVESVAGTRTRIVQADLAGALTSDPKPSGSCLVLALPYHTEIEKPTVDTIDRWVSRGGGLFVLGYYLADVHHETRINSLARVLGFEFGSDLLMPPGDFGRRDYQNQAFSHQGKFAVKVSTGVSNHPVLEDVTRLSVISSCSLRDIQADQVEFELSADPVSVVRVRGPKTAEGYIRQIRDYVTLAEQSRKVAAGWRYGQQGKVVAAGTWKIFTLAADDNVRFVGNALNWLSGPDAGL